MALLFIAGIMPGLLIGLLHRRIFLAGDAAAHEVQPLRDRGVEPAGRAVDVVLVVANLDPHSTRATTLRLDLGALGLDPGESLEAHDLLTDQRWVWGRDVYVRLGPEAEPAHVVAVRGLR